MILLFLSQKGQVSFESFVSKIFGKICYVTCMINNAGKLIYLVQKLCNTWRFDDIINLENHIFIGNFIVWVKIHSRQFFPCLQCNKFLHSFFKQVGPFKKILTCCWFSSIGCPKWKYQTWSQEWIQLVKKWA